MAALSVALRQECIYFLPLYIQLKMKQFILTKVLKIQTIYMLPWPMIFSISHQAMFSTRMRPNEHVSPGQWGFWRTTR